MSYKVTSGRLSDIAEIDMGQSPPGESCSKIFEGTPLLNGPTEFGDFHPYPVQYTSDVRKKSKKGDILFCVRGSTTGRMNYSDQTYAIGRGLAALRHKSGYEYQPYLKAVLEYNLPILLGSCTGSTFPNVSQELLKNLEISIPPLETQKEIAHILGTLDDKIELNRRMNKTLEEIAQTIFKHWFIDFEFPNADGKPYKSSGGEMIDSELGLIPKGWRIGYLEELGKIVTGKTPSTKVEAYYSSEIPFITIPDMHNAVYVIKTQKMLSKTGADSQKAQYIPKNSISVSCIATLGLVCLSSELSQTNQQINSIVPYNPDECYFIYMIASNLSQFIKGSGSGGSVFSNLNKGIFSKLQIVLPTTDLKMHYYKQVRNLFMLIYNNLYQNKTIELQRSQLLCSYFRR